MRNGGTETLESFYGEDIREKRDDYDIVQDFKKDYPELLEFIKNLPAYYEWGNFIFVHAGIDLTLGQNWKETRDPEIYRWTRGDFIEGKNKTGKKIVFGHTPTFMIKRGLFEKKSSEIWTAKDNKIGIDGGGVYGGQFHGVIFNQDGIEKIISVQA
jgi:serine/threonine protein phosphatase 1